ncbi:MAG TPA: GIY-YIG nuclease family protein [Thermomicrobiaceae bacterium]|nr:GIY-YIG nuclease family protein [Thermomicrobiaceae bacterium]
MKTYCVYILASATRVLYIGMTNDLERRVWEHKDGSVPGFTSRYSVTRLVLMEDYSDVREAIAREKQLKSWRREKKVALIEAENPARRDLSSGWYM